MLARKQQPICLRKEEKLPGLREHINGAKSYSFAIKYLMPSIYLEFSLKFQSKYQITPQIHIGNILFLAHVHGLVQV